MPGRDHSLQIKDEKGWKLRLKLKIKVTLKQWHALKTIQKKINETHHRLHLWVCSVTFGVVVLYPRTYHTVRFWYCCIPTSIVSRAAHMLVYLFTPFLKETFISEATWLKVTWRRPVAYTGQRSSCACQLGSAPRFCSLILPCYTPRPLSSSWSSEH